MKNNRKTNGKRKPPLLVGRAERAFRRVARKVRAEHRQLGLQPIVWPNGKRALRGSLKGKKAMEVFTSERKRERQL